jgi:hypothetical protein
MAEEKKMELKQIAEDPCRFVTRLPDLDVPIRRIFKFDMLLDILRSKQMGLVAPQKWEDPREDPTALCMLDGFKLTPPKGQTSLALYLVPVWSQCWSLNPGSDTLLRAYSHVRKDEKTRRNLIRENEGVAVTTTVRKMLAAAEDWNRDGADCHVVLGRVEYLDDREIWQRIVNACNGEHGPQFFCTVQGRADSLMWKRTYFDHEDEVRLLLISREWDRNATSPPVRNVWVDPDALFTSISVDPRLEPFEANEREAELKDAGFGGEIRRDDSYQKVVSQLMMERDWSDP